MPSTAVQKVLARASGKKSVAVGEVIYPDPELVIIHDGIVETLYNELAGLGYGRIVQPERVVFVTDHEVAYGSQKAVERGRNIRRIAKEWNIGQMFDVGRGGHGHIFPMEMGLVKPGMFLFAYDMHCTNFGSVGALAMASGYETSTVLATGSLWTQVPHTILVRLSGKLQGGAHPRDLGFLLAQGFATQRWGINCDYRVIEFGGEGLAHLDLASRVALCNSVTELGAANVFFPCREVASDADAKYELEIDIDLARVSPQVALPGGPERAADVDEAAGRPIDHAFIGSCGSSMYEDFALAAGVLRGKRIAEGVRMFVVPGSIAIAQRLSAEGLTQVFLDAGAMVLPSGCGPCAGGLMGPLGSGEVSISTAATNHSGRFGAADGDVYLGSPLTVAASAIAGRITRPTEA